MGVRTLLRRLDAGVATNYPVEPNDYLRTFYQSMVYLLRPSTVRERAHGQNAPNH